MDMKMAAADTAAVVVAATLQRTILTSFKWRTPATNPRARLGYGLRLIVTMPIVHSINDNQPLELVAAKKSILGHTQEALPLKFASSAQPYKARIVFVSS
jgi:hypothetical protein